MNRHKDQFSENLTDDCNNLFLLSVGLLDDEEFILCDEFDAFDILNKYMYIFHI